MSDSVREAFDYWFDNYPPSKELWDDENLKDAHNAGYQAATAAADAEWRGVVEKLVDELCKMAKLIRANAGDDGTHIKVQAGRALILEEQAREALAQAQQLLERK